MKRINKVILITHLTLLLFVNLSGQSFKHDNDHVLNYKGESRITLATGIPYIAIGEYAYGFSDRTTVGILGGLTPSVTGFGIRVRTIVNENNNFRIYFCTPIFFYPKTKDLGGDAWWLTRPNINFEWLTTSGFRYKIGCSLIAAASHNTIIGNPFDINFRPGVWNAVHSGFSLPLSQEIILQCEASLVMKGLKIADDDWVGGPPVILILGISYTIN